MVDTTTCERFEPHRGRKQVEDYWQGGTVVVEFGRWSGTLVLLEGGWVVRYITKSDGQLFVGW